MLLYSSVLLYELLWISINCYSVIFTSGRCTVSHINSWLSSTQWTSIFQTKRFVEAINLWFHCSLALSIIRNISKLVWRPAMPVLACVCFFFRWQALKQSWWGRSPSKRSPAGTPPGTPSTSAASAASITPEKRPGWHRLGEKVWTLESRILWRDMSQQRVIRQITQACYT